MLAVFSCIYSSFTFFYSVLISKLLAPFSCSLEKPVSFLTHCSVHIPAGSALDTELLISSSFPCSLSGYT